MADQAKVPLKGVLEWVRSSLCPHPMALQGAIYEFGCLRMQPKLGHEFHLRINTSERPILNKYHKEKMKRTLKRQSNIAEILRKQAMVVGDMPHLGVKRR